MEIGNDHLVQILKMYGDRAGEKIKAMSEGHTRLTPCPVCRLKTCIRGKAPSPAPQSYVKF